MPAYADITGTSPITAYEVGEGAITVSFEPTARHRNGRTYLYNQASCGLAVVNSLIDLAATGQGLATYIARERPSYARRW